jgi:hypothetical protein
MHPVPLLDGEIDREVYCVLDHGPTLFEYSQEISPRLDSFQPAAIVPAQNDAANATGT